MLRFLQIASSFGSFALLILFGSCSGHADRAALPVVSSCAQLRHLPSSEARRGYPVRLHGTVTFYDSEYRMLILQDGTGGAFVDSREQDLDNVVAGLTADVEGYSGFEDHDPVVVKPRIRIGSVAVLPAARRVPMSRVIEGQEDFQYVEVAGRLQGMFFVNNIHLRFVLTENNRTLEAIVSTQNPMPEWPADTAVLVRGVASVLRDGLGNPRSARLYVSRFQDIQEAVPNESEAPPSAIPGPGLPLLTRVDQVKRLTSKEAGKHYPVRVRGTVNLHNAKSQSLFLQDSTGGIYVTLRGSSLPPLSPGTQVEVEGVSNPGDFAPSIHHAIVRVLSPGGLFPALEISEPADLAVSDENRWARIHGVARKNTTIPNPGVQIDLEVRGRHFPIDVIGEPRSATDSQWIDAELEAEGILGALFDENRRLQGFHLMVPGREFVKVTRPAPGKPFAVAASSLEGLFGFSLEGVPRHRVKVAGTVTATRLGGRAYLAAGGTALRLQTNGVSGARVGDMVEALGFLPLGTKLQVLEEVELRILGPGSPGDPAGTNAEDLLTGAMDSRLVWLEARLVDRRRSHGDEILTLQAGKTNFTALLEQPQPFPGFETLRIGSMLRLTGVCDTTWDATRTPPEPVSFRLLLRSPADVAVVQLASWWTARNTLGVLASVCALMVVVLAWVFVLQRRVNNQTAMIAARLERETQLQAQLAQAQRLESVGRLAGGVAHDFNNLLTVINGYGDLALSRLRAGDPLRPQLEQIRRAGERAAVLTQQLLGFSRKQIIQPKPVNLNAIVSDAVNMLRPMLGELIAVHTVLQPALGQVVADTSQIDQILMNLAANARDAMPHGGTLKIETREVEVDHFGKNADVQMPPGLYVLLTVTDTGAGMSEETLQNIFEPFFTTKEHGRGTGLGLATVYGIVKQNGGWIDVQSEPGKGTTFRVWFPRTSGIDATAPAPMPAPVSGGSEILLVVEDEEGVRKFAVEVLKSRGYTVLSSEDAEAALALSERYANTIHLLVTDVVLPGMNGRELARRLKAIRPAMQVLFTSGYNRDVIAEHGVLEPGTAYLAKPYSTGELASKVRELLSKEI
jgi:signal transduction histidine kinase/CheY-like chemotaxis protein